MDQSRALNALAPFVALAKSANSPRAAADLIRQATSAQNTSVFAELLQQPNIRALKANEQYGASHRVLEMFSFGTWEEYHATPGLPALSDAQALKLRLLSLLTIAATKPPTAAAETNLSYTSLSARLGLTSPIDLEHLITQAIYQHLLTATLNPAKQTVVITSLAPLRDLAPGSISSMITELEAWSGRCTSVLSALEAEIANIRADAAKRAQRDALVEQQVKAMTDNGEKGRTGVNLLGASKGGHNVHGNGKRDGDDEEDNGDSMDVDGGLLGQGKKRSGGGGAAGVGGIIGRALRGGK